jgi:hypothetical protein
MCIRALYHGTTKEGDGGPMVGLWALAGCTAKLAGGVVQPFDAETASPGGLLTAHMGVVAPPEDPFRSPPSGGFEDNVAAGLGMQSRLRVGQVGEWGLAAGPMGVVSLTNGNSPRFVALHGAVLPQIGNPTAENVRGGTALTAEIQVGFIVVATVGVQLDLWLADRPQAWWTLTLGLGN